LYECQLMCVQSARAVAQKGEKTENKSSLLERLCTAKGRCKELTRTVRFPYVKLRPKVVLRLQA